MLRSIDTCQIKISADQCHVTTSWAQVQSSLRSAVILKLTTRRLEVLHGHTTSTIALNSQPALFIMMWKTVWKVFSFCIFSGFITTHNTLLHCCPLFVVLRASATIAFFLASSQLTTHFSIVDFCSSYSELLLLLESPMYFNSSGQKSPKKG